MDIKQLRYFIAIAEEGSLSAAAQRVNVAQPSLSQHVLSLERELDVKLLERSSRGVSLTQSGEVLLSHAREITNALQNAANAVRQSGGEPIGDVTVGLPSSISMVLTVPLAETVWLDLPKVRLRAINAMSGFIQEWLEDQSIDIGFLYDISSVKHLKYQEIMTEELQFFSAPDAWPFESRTGSDVTLSQLAKLDLVLPSSHHGLRKLIDRTSKSNGIELKISSEMDALNQIKTMVSRGSCHTILAPAAAHDFVQRGELIAANITDPQIVRPVFIVRNPSKPISTASREVERIAITVVKDLLTRGVWQATETFDMTDL